MIILRLLLFLAALALILSGGLYLFTGNRRYLGLAWQIVRFTAFALMVFGALYLLERYALVGWRILV